MDELWKTFQKQFDGWFFIQSVRKRRNSHDVIEEIEERQKVANTRRTELGLFLNLFNPKYKIFYMNLIYVINILRKN